MNMMILQWWRELKSDGIKAWAVAPRYMATNVGHDEEGWKNTGITRFLLRWKDHLWSDRRGKRSLCG